MDNYIVIEGKRIELPDELVDHIREQLNETKYVSFVENTENFNTMHLEKTRFCEIGQAVVTPELVGRCFVLYKDYEWNIIEKSN